MLLVLLISWLTETALDDPSNVYDMVEMFAGVGMVSKVFRECGFRAAAIDVQYNGCLKREGSMDLTTPSGFVSPSWLITLWIFWTANNKITRLCMRHPFLFQ